MSIWMPKELVRLFKPDYEDEDFMSELEAATRIRPTTSATLMLFAIIALVVFGILWAAISQVEERTRGQGKVVPSQDIQIVQSLEGGVLQELLVREGDHVKKGDVLLRVSDVHFSSSQRGTRARFTALKAKKARLQAEVSGEEFVAPAEITEKNPIAAENERALFVSRQNELKNVYQILDDKIAQASAQIAETQALLNRLTQSRALLQEEFVITQEMVKKRAVPKLEELRLQRELGDMSGQMNEARQRQKGLEAELEVAKNEKASQADRFRSQALSELGEVETEIAELEGSLESIGDRVDRAELRAPVGGTINKIAVTTIGGVIEPAQKLVEIVPLGDELKVIAQVSPNDIAFIRPGQEAKVKITAYNPQKYGSLNGKITRLGANSATDQQGNVFFEIEVHTDKNYLGTIENPLPITPGMIANVEIITGKRSILEYLLKPVLRARDVAFTER